MRKLRIFQNMWRNIVKVCAYPASCRIFNLPFSSATSSTAIVQRSKALRFDSKEHRTNLVNYLRNSDVQKRQNSLAQSGSNRFVGICIAIRNKGIGSSFILRNVIGGIPVERTFETYCPKIKEIKVLKLEKRRRSKLYYLRDKPNKYSTVNEYMEPSKIERVVVHRRKGAPA